MVNYYKRQERIRKFYYNSMTKLYFSMLEKAKNQKEPFKLIKVVEKLSKTYQFEQYTQYVAYTTMQRIEKVNAATWKESFYKSQKPNKFYKDLIEATQGNIQTIMSQKAQENSFLIKTMPALWAQKATDICLEEGLKGRRSSEIKKDILALYSELSDTEAKRIARTEVSKTSSILTQARSQAIGSNWYFWRTANDAIVRESHDHMENVICNFNSPPDPEKLAGLKSYGKYNAGEIFNDRCYSEPILDFKDIVFPAKVHYKGQILKMKKSEFLLIATQ